VTGKAMYDEAVTAYRPRIVIMLSAGTASTRVADDSATVISRDRFDRYQPRELRREA
jgi:hypothetical protein